MNCNGSFTSIKDTAYFFQGFPLSQKDSDAHFMLGDLITAFSVNEMVIILNTFFHNLRIITAVITDSSKMCYKCFCIFNVAKEAVCTSFRTLIASRIASSTPAALSRMLQNTLRRRLSII